MPCHLINLINFILCVVRYDVTEEDVKSIFAVCGKIANVRLAMWNHTKAMKGFGYVDFVQEASAEIAVKKQGQLKVRKH